MYQTFHKRHIPVTLLIYSAVRLLERRKSKKAEFAQCQTMKGKKRDVFSVPSPGEGRRRRGEEEERKEERRKQEVRERDRRLMEGGG